MTEKTRKYKVGDKVNYTNANGVNWGEKTIIGVEDITYSDSGNGYYLEPTGNPPWYAVKEECLSQEKTQKTKSILGYCDYSETIRQLPENYLIAHKDGNVWKCEPDLAASKELCIKVFTELLNYESKYQVNGLELLSKLTPTYDN